METSRARHLHYTVEDYRRLELDSPVKHEYYQGEIYAMAGGTLAHAVRAMAVGSLLRAQVLGRCLVSGSDARIRILAGELFTYPDLSVICGKPQYDVADRLTVINPVLLAEVTSDSTEDYDRGAKLAHYQEIPTLREVLFISHRESRLTLHRREGDAWVSVEARGGETLALALGVTLAVDDVYADQV